MATAETTLPETRHTPPRARETRSQWLAVVVAAVAMVATLPGRTHGLGLVTEPLLADLRMDRVTFAMINLWATLLGAAFCLPCGWLIDRFGGRLVLLGVTTGLAASVGGMSRAGADWGGFLVPALFALVLMTRGLGQSALSVVSLALMGRAVRPGPGIGVGFYSFVTALGFMTAFSAIKYVLESWEPGWRPLWCGIGVIVAGFGLLASLVPRQSMERAGPEANNNDSGLTLSQTLRTSAFWVFAGATALYGLVAAGVSLFNQSILAERHFDRGVFLTLTALSPLVGLAANLATGWLGRRVAPGRLLAGAMLLLAASLICFPLVRALWHIYLYAAAMGIAGGIVTVIFFGVWGQVFGTAHLGKVQGAAQMLTVLASAAGPLLLAAGHRATGSYVPVFQGAATAATLCAFAAWFVPLPHIEYRQGTGSGG